MGRPVQTEPPAVIDDAAVQRIRFSAARFTILGIEHGWGQVPDLAPHVERVLAAHNNRIYALWGDWPACLAACEATIDELGEADRYSRELERAETRARQIDAM